MCKLLGQHHLRFRWKLSEIRNLDFFSRMKNKEAFFSSEEAPFPGFLASLMESPWGQRSSAGVCVLLHEGLYQPFESRSACLGGKGCAWQLSKSHQASLLVVLWSHQDCKNLCTLLDTSNCVLWLLRTIFALWMWKTAVWKNIFGYVDFWRKTASKSQISNLYTKTMERYRWEKKSWYYG